MNLTVYSGHYRRQYDDKHKEYALNIRIGRIFLFAFTLVCCSCSSSDTDELKAVEIETDSALTSDAPEAVLLETAKRLYGNGLYSVARTSFESLQATYPLGPYAEYAQIKIADCFFHGREYDSAAAAYQAFLKEHPTNESRDYVTFKTGLSHFLSSKGVGHDISPIENGLAYFKETVRLYPDSPYATSAALYLDKANTVIAAHKKEVMEFYQKQGYESAYEARRAEFEKTYSVALENTHRPLDTAPTRLVSLAAPSIVHTGRRTTQLPKQMMASLKFNSKTLQDSASIQRIEGDVRLQAVHCSGEDAAASRVTLVFDDSDSSIAHINTFATTEAVLNAEDNLVRVTVPGLDADVRSFACSAGSEVQVSPEGTILIETSGSYSLMHLERPNRLLLLQN